LGGRNEKKALLGTVGVTCDDVLTKRDCGNWRELIGQRAWLPENVSVEIGMRRLVQIYK